MKKNFLLALVTCTCVFSSVVFGSIIIQSEALNQVNYAAKTELSNQINSQYSIMELPNGEHDNKHYGIVTFGSYKQDAASDNKTPIEWYILEKRDNNAILLARNVLDSHTYDAKNVYNSWNSSRLKTYLNGMFFEEAFSKQEQNFILSNPYKDVGRVFILTPNEAKYYFSGPREFLSIAFPTQRLIAENSYGAYKYWLEAQGDDDGIEYVNGRLSNQKVYVDSTKRLGIRPCIVVNFDLNPTLASLLSPEFNNASIAGYQSQLPNVTSTITGETLVTPQNNTSNYSILYEASRTTEVFNYKTEDDDDNTKSFMIKIVLPVYAGSDAGQVALMNNLVSVQCFDIVKSYATDYIESRIDSVKKQLTVIPKPLVELGSNSYSVEFEVGTRHLCTIHFDLRLGTCYSETE